MTNPTRLRFSEEAGQELRAAISWYREVRKDLAPEFVRAVEACLASVQRTPMLYPVAHRSDVHRALIKRFPYALFFRVKDNTIDIVSVFHTSRDPQAWKNRS